MTIWVLRERGDADQEDWAEAHGADYSPYSDPHGFVVVASNEYDARKVAAGADYDHRCGERWLDATVTSCEPIADDGNPRVVLGDWPTG